MKYQNLFLFSLLCVSLIYLFDRLVEKRFKKINTVAAVYVSTVAMLGVYTEVLLDKLYFLVVNQPLWEYHVLPIHNGYTSYYSLVIWGMYGFYLYVFHDFLNGRRAKAKFGNKLIALIAVEAILLEVMINSLFLAFFDQYIFYYLPNDLWHLTSIQAIPFYFLLAIVIAKCTQHFRKDPKFFITMNVLLASVLVFFANN